MQHFQKNQISHSGNFRLQIAEDFKLHKIISIVKNLGLYLSENIIYIRKPRGEVTVDSSLYLV